MGDILGFAECHLSRIPIPVNVGNRGKLGYICILRKEIKQTVCDNKCLTNWSIINTGFLPLDFEIIKLYETCPIYINCHIELRVRYVLTNIHNKRE